MARAKGALRRASAEQASARASHLVRSERWNGLRAGDPVEVGGLANKGTTWEFRAHVVNRRNGTESVEVVGGTAGERTVRSFRPERIFAAVGAGARRGKRGPVRASLAEAPQLPFG